MCVGAIVDWRQVSNKPFEWLVKWSGYELDRDAPSSWLKRSQFSTHSAHKALLAFERARKSANEKSTAAGAAAKKKDSRKRSRKPVDVASDDSDGDDDVEESESD